MNAKTLAIAVANNPTVRAYDRAIAKLHKRYTLAYGPNFMDAHQEDKNGFPITHEGVNRWTPAQRDYFTGLYNAAKTYRASVRARYATS